MRRSKAVTVSKQEREILDRTGMFDLAKRRTRAIMRQHVAGNSRVETIACDCYLQGMRDAAQAIDHDERATDE